MVGELVGVTGRGDGGGGEGRLADGLPPVHRPFYDLFPIGEVVVHVGVTCLVGGHCTPRVDVTDTRVLPQVPPVTFMVTAVPLRSDGTYTQAQQDQQQLVLLGREEMGRGRGGVKNPICVASL